MGGEGRRNGYPVIHQQHLTQLSYLLQQHFTSFRIHVITISMCHLFVDKLRFDSSRRYSFREKCIFSLFHGSKLIFQPPFAYTGNCITIRTSTSFTNAISILPSANVKFLSNSFIITCDQRQSPAFLLTSQSPTILITPSADVYQRDLNTMSTLPCKLHCQQTV